MEQHKDLAMGFVKGDRVSSEQLWVELAGELNASGPPKKEVPAWKKVWTDWKLSVKHRLGHNKNEATKTGGGRFNKYVLSPNDEQVALISGLYESVDGVKCAKSYGAPKKLNATILPTTSTAARVSPPPVSPSQVDINLGNTPSPGERRSASPTPTTPAEVISRKRNRQNADVQDVIEMETQQFAKMSKNIENIRSELKENRYYLRQISSSLKTNGRHLKELTANVKFNGRCLKELTNLKKKEVNELVRHNYVIEKNLQQKNIIKLKFLELEQMKLGVYQSTSDCENN